MLSKLHKIKNWQSILLIIFVGIAVYAVGLNNPFQGDDYSQILNDPVVHSVSHIKLLFEGSTFYNGGGIAPLVGVYYKPLMMLLYAVIYAFFGPHPLYYHVVQLVICIGSTIVLYLFFKFSFKPLLALILALIFLVHPIDSQVVYAIPSMQDAMFFFFGILGLYLLVKYSKPPKEHPDYSYRILPIVMICMFLSLLSKETGILFVLISIVYLFLFDVRKRLYVYTLSVTLPSIVWLILRYNAVGFGQNPTSTPIDRLDLAGRLLTAPAIMQLYLAKLVVPWKLASGYFFVDPRFSVTRVLIPALIDVAALGLLVYVGLLISKRAPKNQFYTYVFFGIWFLLGLLAHLQIIPLDMTACEIWFYFPMVGVLGMVGVALETVIHVPLKWLVVAGGLLIIVFSILTVYQGLDWRNSYTLAWHDIAASKEDYLAYSRLAEYYENRGENRKALLYARRAVAIFPSSITYNDLGVALEGLGNDSAAVNAFYSGLQYQQLNAIYDNIGGLTLVYGQSAVNKAFLVQSLAKFPEDSLLWMYLSILEQKAQDNTDAKIAMSNAAKYSNVPMAIYEGVMDNRPFSVSIANTQQNVYVP